MNKIWNWICSILIVVALECILNGAIGAKDKREFMSDKLYSQEIGYGLRVDSKYYNALDIEGFSSIYKSIVIFSPIMCK